MSTKRNHRWNSSKRNSSATSQTSSEPSETTTNPLPLTPPNSNPSLVPDFNFCSTSDDFGTDYFSELFDATVLPAPIDQKNPSTPASMPNDALGMLVNTISSDSDFQNPTAQNQISVDDPSSTFSNPSQISSQVAGNTSIGGVSLASTKNSSLSLQSLDPSLQNIHNDSEFLFRFPYLLPIVNTIATTEAHLQRTSIPIDEAMYANKACMSQISHTMENEEFIQCNSCSLLVATAMQMIIMLYEKALFESDNANPSAAKDDGDSCSGVTLIGSPHSTVSSSLNTTTSTSNHDQQYAVSTRRSANMPCLQFGVFQFEPEEPIWFRNQIIRKELQRCIQTLRACHTEDHQGKRKGGTGASSPGLLAGDRVRKTWLLEMERRANTLIASLPVGKSCDAETDIEKDRARQRDRGRKRSIENALLCWLEGSVRIDTYIPQYEIFHSVTCSLFKMFFIPAFVQYIMF